MFTFNHRIVYDYDLANLYFSDFQKGHMNDNINLFFGDRQTGYLVIFENEEVLNKSYYKKSKLARMSKDELSTRTNTFLLRMLSSDGAGTEGAGDMILGSLGAPKSIRQQWAEAKIGGVKELPSTVANFLRTALTKNKPTDFANLLDDQAKGLIKYGAAGRAAKAHGLQNPFGEPTGAGAFTPKPSAGSGRASKKGR